MNGATTPRLPRPAEARLTEKRQRENYLTAVAEGSRVSGNRGIEVIPPSLPETVLGWASGVLASGGYALLLRPDWPTGMIRELRAKASVTPQESLRALAPEGGILVATGGSSGRTRFALHTPQSILAAAEPVLRYATKGDPMSVTIALPVDHVSGMMPFLRALISGGSIRFKNYRDPGMTSEGDWLSLVPTQLSTLATNDSNLNELRQLAGILIGGSAADSPLIEKLADQGVPLHLTYGMTETAGMVAAAPASEWLQRNQSAPVLEGHQVEILSENSAIQISSPALATAIWPDSQPLHQPYQTSDLGAWEPHRRLRILGRLDRVAISGGENVDLTRMENFLRRQPRLKSVRLMGEPDPHWGQRIVCFIVASEWGEHDWPAAEAALRKHFPARWLPHSVYLLREAPIDERGKWSLTLARKIGKRIQPDSRHPTLPQE